MSTQITELELEASRDGEIENCGVTVWYSEMRERKHTPNASEVISSVVIERGKAGAIRALDGF